MSSSPSLSLYIDWMSQPSRAVALLLMENNIPFTLKPINIAKGDTQSESFRSVNPLGKVPFIVDHSKGDFHLGESATIMRYIATTRPVAPHWYPSDPVIRARVDEILDWHHSNLRVGSTRSMFAAVFGPQLGVKEESLKRVEREAKKALKESLGYMEKALSSRTYIAGTDAPTIADLQLSQETIMLPLSGASYAEYPNVQRWIKQLEKDIKNWEKATAVLFKVMKLRAKKSSKEGLSAKATSAESSPPALSFQWTPHALTFKCLPIFDTMKSHLSDPKEADGVSKLQSSFRYDVHSDGDAKKKLHILIDLKEGRSFNFIKEIDPKEEVKSDATFSVSDSNFIALSSGRLSGPMAYTTGRFKVEGNLQKAMAWNTQIARAQTKVSETIKKHGLEKGTKGKKSNL